MPKNSKRGSMSTQSMHTRFDQCYRLGSGSPMELAIAAAMMAETTERMVNSSPTWQEFLRKVQAVEKSCLDNAPLSKKKKLRRFWLNSDTGKNSFSSKSLQALSLRQSITNRKSPLVLCRNPSKKPVECVDNRARHARQKTILISQRLGN